MEGIDPNWDEIVVEGRSYPDSEIPPLRMYQYVSPGFFQAAGTRIIAGRDLTWTEVHGLRPVVLLSENLARELWGSPSAAIGKHVRESPGMPWSEVIGVVQDVFENGVHEKAPEIVYWPPIWTRFFRTRSNGNCHPVRHVRGSKRSHGRGGFSQPDPASCLVGECQPAGGIDANHARHLRSIARAHFFHPGDAGDRGRDGAGAGRHRHLRRDLLCRIAAQA